MAKIIKKGTDLEEKLLRYVRRKRGCLIIGAVLLVISFIMITLCDVFALVLTGGILGGAAFILFMFWLLGYERDIEITAAGIRGERNAIRSVALLPDSYTVFSNLSLAYKEKRSEIDLVIVGPTGVFVVETKNLNGSISGGANDAQWIQYKVGRGGTPYSKRFYNPMKQVNTHVYRLANHLRDNGIWAYVNATVYFVNIETDINIDGTDGKTELFSARRDGANKLLHYVVNNNQRLTRTECDKIISLLKRV